ncbi:hypothetical protein [Microbacterium sp. NPDC056569]|uniref:hypothetical protein n=1 Tax=Microbacterium sp. NPDC056569 TaxID=3345867 RepID=UPI003671C448
MAISDQAPAETPPTRRSRRSRRSDQGQRWSTLRYVGLWASRRTVAAVWPGITFVLTMALIVVGLVMGEQPPGIIWIAGVSGLLVLAFWGAAFVASLRLHRLWGLLDSYVAQHGGRVQTLRYSSQPSEILSARGEGGLSRTTLTLLSGTRIGDWEYVREWNGRHTRSAYVWGYVAIPLTNSVPHIVLDSRRNQRVTAIGAGVTLTRSQVLSLEGDFDRHFTVYCPDGYGADALYFLTPDVMADLVDTAHEWDVEFIDDQVVFFRPGPILHATDTAIDELVALARSWELRARNWSRWRDQRLGSAPAVDSTGQLISAPSGVHESGVRLNDTRLLTIGAIAFILLIAGLYAYTVLDMIQR